MPGKLKVRLGSSFESWFSWFLFGLLTLLVLLDLLMNLFPIAGKAAMLLWLLSCVVLVGTSVHCLVGIARSLVANQWWFSPALVLVLSLALVANAADPAFLQYELPQQVACFLRRFPTREAGFHDPCFLGYPTRGYAAASLPSLLFGRGLFALKLGGSLYFLCGIWIFLSGVLHHLGPGRKSDLLALVAITILFHCFALPGLLLPAEQAQAPFALSLALCGWYLRYLTTRRLVFALLAGLVLHHLAVGYPPGLVLAALGLAVLVRHSVLAETARHRLALAALALSVVAVFAISLTYRRDVASSRLVKNTSETSARVMAATKHLVVDQSRRVAFSAVFKPFAVALLLVSLSGFLGWKFSFLALWFVASAVAVTTATGYSNNAPPNVFFRMACMAPVLSLMAIEAIARLRVRWAPVPMVAGVLAAFFFTAALPRWASAAKKRDGARFMPFVHWAVGPLKQTHPEVKLAMGPMDELIAKDLFHGARDRLVYFRPDIQFKKTPESCGSLVPAEAFLILAVQSSRCLQDLQRYRPQLLAEFPDSLRAGVYLIRLP